MSFSTKRKDRGKDAMVKAAREMYGKPYVAVGIMGTEQREDGKIKNWELGTIHEFGTEKIPARSFLRSTYKEHLSEMRAIIKKLHHKVLHEKMKKGDALALIGEKFTALVKAKITAHIPPPNEPATIARKGSSTPLVDTGQLLNSIRYEVRE
jgi:hypothetical protein